MSKWTLLCEGLVGGRAVEFRHVPGFRGGDGFRAFVRSVEREDGSGRCFNVAVRVDDGTEAVVFVRTED